MSKGYFFELNKHLSAVEKGVAIFDYTELPAHEGSNLNTPLAEQYPISVDINGDAVCFKLHYCTYHYINDKSIDYHQHLETSAIDQGNWGLTHVEDVILELPYAANATSRLSSVIKNSYNTEFPLKYSTKEQLHGYLEHLIRDQFKIKTQADTSQVPERPLDVFYSSQWLMDIYDDSGEVNVYENNDPNAKITKFLRKLVLDFMFDLKHSDVFQSSVNFQRMLTGLMSDFYFSSLIHKCEFFYYRDLIMSEVKPIKDDSKDEAKDDNKDDRFTYLYAKELFNAQELWTNDIMNPLSESYFEHDFPDRKVQLLSIFCEKLNAKKWNSWFATPEEEMRRVYFTMNEWGKPCNCNVDTLTEFLDLSNKEDEGIKSMLAFQQENREMVSRWFLSRYDFNDVFRIHFFRFSNLSFLALLIILLCLFFFGDKYIEKSFPWLIDQIMKHTSYIGILAIVLLIIRSFLSMNRAEVLLCARNQLRAKRLLEIGACFCIFIFFISEGIKEVDKSILFQGGWLAILIKVAAILILLFPFFNLINRYLICQKLEIKLKLFNNFIDFIDNCFRRQFLIHPFRNMHIILPKLIASITAAWLTLSTGYVIYSSFFNVKVSPFTPIVITTIVISFTMSRISRTMPTASSRLLLFRAIEIAIISYCIALVIGLVAINFVGERYLCQNETFKELKKEIADISKNSNDAVKIEKEGDSIKYKAIRHENMIQYYVSNKDKNGNYRSERLLAVEHIKTSPKYDMFIMSDSLNNTCLFKNETFKELKKEIAGIYKNGCDTVRIEKEGDNNKYKAIRQENMTQYFVSIKNKDGNYDPEILFAVNYTIPSTKHDLFIMPEFLKIFSFITMFIGIFLQMAFFDARQMTDF